MHLSSDNGNTACTADVYRRYFLVFGFFAVLLVAFIIHALFVEDFADIRHFILRFMFSLLDIQGIVAWHCVLAFLDCGLGFQYRELFTAFVRCEWTPCMESAARRRIDW